MPPLRPHCNHTTCRKGGTLDDRDPFCDSRDREPRQARLAREGHRQPPVQIKVAEEAREWAWRLGIGSGELAESSTKAGASLTSREGEDTGPRGSLRHTVPATRGSGRRLRWRATPQRNVRWRGQAREGLRDSRHRPLLRQQVLHQGRRRSPSCRDYDLEEFEIVRSHTDRAVKIPFTSCE